MNIKIIEHKLGEITFQQYGVYNAFNTAIDPYRSKEQVIAAAIATIGGNPERAEHWKRMGEFYGYPACCVSVFIKNCCAATKRYYDSAPWDGTGFVPCMCCAVEAAKDFPAWVATRITPNRVSGDPFTFAGE